MAIDRTLKIKIDTRDMDSKLASLADEAAQVHLNRGHTNRQISNAINKAMKQQGRYAKWSFSYVGSFIAILAKDDTSVGDAYACLQWFKGTYPHLVGKNMAPTITSNMDGHSLINLSVN